MTNREKWKAVLPAIQAFVEGKPIQRKDYDGRWKDADSMYSLMSSEYRVKPADIVQGMWTAAFTYEELTSKLHGTAVLEWPGTNRDEPKWPKENFLKLVEGSERFTPADQVEGMSA